MCTQQGEENNVQHLGPQEGVLSRGRGVLEGGLRNNTDPQRKMPLALAYTPHQQDN